MTYRPTYSRIIRAINRSCDWKDNLWNCTGDHKATEIILEWFGVSATAREYILQVFRMTGGYCTCEIIFNSIDTPIRKLINYLLVAFR